MQVHVVFPLQPKRGRLSCCVFVLLHSRTKDLRLRLLPLAQGVGVVAGDVRLLRVRLQANVLATAGLDPSVLGCRQSSEAGAHSVH